MQGDPNTEELSTEEITSVEEVTNSDAPANGGMVLINLESIIKSHIASISKMEEDANKFKGLLDDIFNNDAEYKDLAEKSKEASKAKSGAKQRILKIPQAADLFQKVTTLKSEVKELSEALSDYLKEYERMSGLSVIEGDDGEVRKIIYTAKLIKQSSRP